MAVRTAFKDSEGTRNEPIYIGYDRLSAASTLSAPGTSEWILLERVCQIPRNVCFKK